MWTQTNYYDEPVWIPQFEMDEDGEWVEIMNPDDDEPEEEDDEEN